MNQDAGKYPIPWVVLIIHDAHDRILLRIKERTARAELPGWPLLRNQDYRMSALKGFREFAGSDLEPSGVYAIVQRAIGTADEALVIVMLAMIPDEMMDSLQTNQAELRLAQPGRPLPPMAHESDLSLIRRLWSGEWSVISRHAGYFSDGGGI